MIKKKPADKATRTKKRGITLSTQKIGRMGELLVQFELLRYGIDSAPMTTDTGIDLVAFSATKGRSFTIQVKTNLKPKPGGGKGKLGLDWWVKDDCPAEYYAFVDVSSPSIWILNMSELVLEAQQKPAGRLHFCMSTDSESKSYTRCGDVKYTKYLFKYRVSELFRGFVN